MNYGNTYTLKYISKNGNRILFDIIDENQTNMVLDGTMNDLKNVLYYSDGLDAESDFNALQESIFNNPVTFIAKRKPLKHLNELDFNL